MKISTILEKIDENQLFIPAFQREYVWKRDDAKQLIDSLIKEYPTGTILQLIPTEAMVKHDRAAFPKTNGWEFFALKVSADGTAIQDRGDKVLNTSLN